MNVSAVVMADRLADGHAVAIMMPDGCGSECARPVRSVTLVGGSWVVVFAPGGGCSPLVDRLTVTGEQTFRMPRVDVVVQRIDQHTARVYIDEYGLTGYVSRIEAGKPNAGKLTVCDLETDRRVITRNGNVAGVRTFRELGRLFTRVHGLHDRKDMRVSVVKDPGF